MSFWKRDKYGKIRSKEGHSIGTGNVTMANYPSPLKVVYRDPNGRKLTLRGKRTVREVLDEQIDYDAAPDFIEILHWSGITHWDHPNDSIAISSDELKVIQERVQDGLFLVFGYDQEF